MPCKNHFFEVKRSIFAENLSNSILVSQLQLKRDTRLNIMPNQIQVYWGGSTITESGMHRIYINNWWNDDWWNAIDPLFWLQLPNFPYDCHEFRISVEKIGRTESRDQ